jgi:hypothetical protein
MVEGDSAHPTARRVPILRRRKCAAGRPQDRVDVTRLETTRDKERRRERRAPVQQDSIAFFNPLGRDYRLHRHPKLHRTTLCVSGPRNQ